MEDRDLKLEPNPVATESEVTVVGDQDLSGLLRPELAASFAASLTQRYGPIHAIVGHLKFGT